jgi:hypothetical protein
MIATSRTVETDSRHSPEFLTFFIFALLTHMSLSVEHMDHGLEVSLHRCSSQHEESLLVVALVLHNHAFGRLFIRNTI